MTTMTGDSQTEVNQSLIDSRLDTIDRALNGRMPRRERLAIVREVEGQIHEMLGQRRLNTLEPGNILDVLARLDPPEAYLSDSDVVERAPTRVQPISRTSRVAAAGSSRISTVTGVLGLSSAASAIFPTVLLAVALAVGGLTPSGLIIALHYMFVGTAFLLGLLTLILAPCIRFRGGFTIVGYVAGLLGFIAAIACILLN